jgi:hypothetical protein
LTHRGVNAVIESWFSTVKSQEAERFESYAHAKEVLVDYGVGTAHSVRSVRLSSSVERLRQHS